ncbi:hypothetical protein, conserved [Eimeria maxima]|uniref:CSC1/OSCA1-like 7TM region domain-containing protein n=1 Tax=Eimeria maxima TaxID=5804 RepID=U6MAJ2_EIMMA|nr:hypothetical protein, conserved [Eimeria maxima]CDJ60058.1 hypothetical protein, conserved [Eimeria maxima]
MRGLQTGIGLIKLVEDWIMSVNGSAIQEALSNPVSEYHMKPSVPVVHNALSSDMSLRERHISRTAEQRILLGLASSLYKCLGSLHALVLQLRVMRRDCLLPILKKPISQADFNRLQEGPDFCTPTKYAAMMQGFCSLSLYVMIAPFLSVQAMCTWLLLYWIYKCALLRLAKRPNPEMTAVVNQAILVLRASVLLLAAGSFLLRPTTTGSAVQTLHICGFSAGVVALVSILLPRWLQLKFTYLCATGAKPTTWQTVHYYKLQHAFFVHYHTSNPVYASWGPERNPQILREPGVSACSPGATAKAFAARGAAKRARRRMAAFKTRIPEAASACNIPKAGGVNSSAPGSDSGCSDASGSSSRDSSDSETTDDLVPNAAAMRRLRATLVEGRAAPEFQRLLIESQSKSTAKPKARASAAQASASSKQSKDAASGHSPSFQGTSRTNGMKEAVKSPLGRDRSFRSQQSLLSGEAFPRNAATESDDTGESEQPSNFTSWLQSLLLKHLYFIGCSLSESEGSGVCADSACGSTHDR